MASNSRSSSSESSRPCPEGETIFDQTANASNRQVALLLRTEVPRYNAFIDDAYPFRKLEGSDTTHLSTSAIYSRLSNGPVVREMGNVMSPLYLNYRVLTRT